MRPMPNLHVREVPPEAVEVLRAAAKRNGRSLNAELVDAIVLAADRKRQGADLLERLESVRRAWRERNPQGYPPGLEPETIIRRARDAG
jgi:Arc-like DNA binding domain